jgi:metallo-beta-lactamase family protein
MRLTFLGAAGTVTGSRFLLEQEGRRLLVDCGLFQGLKILRQRNRQPLPVEPASIAAVALTHAHIDHSGYLPALVRGGFDGPVYCTPATADLLGILLPDSGRIQEEDARLANREGFSRHHPALPLYTEEDARTVLGRLIPVDFGEPFRAGPFRGSLRPAGHILGAAGVTLESAAGRIHFSGDLGRAEDLLLPAAEPPPEADWLVMESTYGDRAHPDGDPFAVLRPIVRRTLERGGVLLIPSFAVARAQTMLYCIWRLLEEGAIPRVPVFLDSPMATSATDLYRLYHRLHRLDEATTETAFGIADYVSSVSQSKRISASRGPMIVVSSSGMATGGRVLHHLKAFAPDAANTVLLPGFQAPGTRGASLAAGAESVKIHGRYVPVRAEVVQLDLFSAHADRDDLLAWLAARPSDPHRIFLVHGEPEPADSLRRSIEETQGLEVEVAEHLETVELLRGEGE